MEYVRQEANSIGSLNAELEKIEIALNHKVGTEEDGPRTMRADLDMNSNQILNLPTPIYSTDPIRLGDIANIFADIQGLTSDILKWSSVSVEHYGASVGNTPAANAIAIQTALNENAGKRSVFMPEIYLVDRTILVPSNTVWFGVDREKSGLKMASYVNRGEPVVITGHRLVRGQNIIIRDMKLDFNRDRWTVSPSRSSWQDLVPDAPLAGSNHEVNRSTLMVCNSKNVKLERLKVIDAYKHNIDISAPWYGDGVGNAITYDTHSSEYVVVEDCIATGAGDDNITTHQCSYVWINRCVAGESSGAMVAGNSNAFEIDDGSRNVWVTNFVAYKADNGVQIKGHQDRPAPYNVFVNNGVILNCRNSLEIRHTGWYGSLTDVEDLEPLLDENGNPITVSGSSQTARNVFVDNVMIVAPREWSTGGTMRPAHSCIRIRSYENVALSNISCIDGALDLAKTIDGYNSRTPLSSGRIVQINQGASKVRFDNLTIQGFADETSGVRIYGTAGDGLSIDGFTVINGPKNGLYQSGTAAVSIDNYTIIGDQMSNTTPGKFETDPNSYGIRTTDNIGTSIGAGKIQGYPFPVRFRGVEHPTAINGINMPHYMGRGATARVTNADGFNIERSVEAGTGRMLRLKLSDLWAGYLFATQLNTWLAYDKNNQEGGILGNATDAEGVREGLYQWGEDGFIPIGDRNLGSASQPFNALYTKTGVEAHTPINVLRDVTPTSARKRYDLTRVGVSPNNVNQSIAADEVNGYLYTHHISTTAVPGVEATVINRFKLGGTVFQTALDSSQADVRLGHQGLGIQHTPSGEPWLWTSAPYDSATSSGSKAVRFRYRRSADGAMDAPQVFTLYELDGSDQVTTPTISSDGRWLVVKKTEGSTHRFRGFDIRTLDAGGAGDYSNNFAFEFTVPTLVISSVTQPLQDIVCDGAYVYALMGDGDSGKAKYLRVYDLRGKLVSEHSNLTIGKSEAVALDATYYEPEGMCIVKTNDGDKLLICMVGGSTGARRWFIHESAFSVNESAGKEELLYRFIAEVDGTPDLRLGLGGAVAGVFYNPEQFVGYKVRFCGKSAAGSTDALRMRFNNDTTAGAHRNKYWFTDNTGATTYEDTPATTVFVVNDIPSSADASEFSIAEVFINNPATANLVARSVGTALTRNRVNYTAYQAAKKLDRVDFWIGGTSIGTALPWKAGSYIEVYGVRK